MGIKESRWILENVDIGKVVSGNYYPYWQRHGLKFFLEDEVFTADLKSRKIGWSLYGAIWGYARCMIRPRWTVYFVSFNAEEAAERIRDIKLVWDATRFSSRKKIIIENQLSVEFLNGSRVISRSNQSIRGIRGDVVCDEVAFWDRGEEIVMEGVLPAVTQNGQVRLGSTCGEAGDFFDRLIHNDRGNYSGWKTRTIPWWESEILCSNPDEATQNALMMELEERIEKYGTDRLKVIFHAMSPENFMREYECHGDLVQENLLRIKDIVACQREYGDRGYIGVAVEGYRDICNAISALLQWAGRDEEFYVGYDVGRSASASSIVVLRLEKGILEVCLIGWLYDTNFTMQEAVIDEIMKGPVKRLVIDNKGIGHDLAERIQYKYPGHVEPIGLVTSNMVIMASQVKSLIEKQNIILPKDYRVIEDLRAVKLRSGNQLVTDRSLRSKSHGDAFWALAMACQSAKVRFSFWNEDGQAVWGEPMPLIRYSRYGRILIR